MRVGLTRKLEGAPSRRRARAVKLTSPRFQALRYTADPRFTCPDLSISSQEGLQMEDTLDFTRRVKRLSLTLPIRVLCRESSDYEWTEQSRLIDVSQFGAGFTLTRPVDVGRLIQLTIPLPHKLRCFDHMEPMYSVWSLVRHAAAISKVNGNGSALFRVGVGFVGKDAPFSYQENPSIRYDPVSVKIGQQSVWRLGRHTTAKERRESRLI